MSGLLSIEIPLVKQKNYKTSLGDNLFKPGGSCKVGFSVPSAGKVTIKICDIKGREIKTLVDGETKSQGDYQTDWNGKNTDDETMPPGIYFLYY